MSTWEGREDIRWKLCKKQFFMNYSPKCIVYKVAEMGAYHGHTEGLC